MKPIQKDGRIELQTDSKFFHTLSRLVPDRVPPKPAPDDARHIEEPPAYSKRLPINLKLNIVIQVVGSRGDVQPFIALGSELVRHGHRIRLATHDIFDKFVRESGLEFYPIGGDPAELMAYMVKNPGLIPSMQSLQAGDVQKKRKMIAEILEGCWQSCTRPDPVSGRPFVAEAIIANPPSFAHVHCAQALGIPVHLMFTMPWSPTKAFPHPLVNLDLEGSSVPVGIANYVSYLAVDWLTWQGLGDIVNVWRDTLNLEPIPRSEGPALVQQLQIPFTYCWSSALVPKPADWPSHIDVCGFFFRDAPDYAPDPELVKFLHDGPPPIYIGFGSIVIDDPAQLTKILVAAVRQAGVRAIISRGWSKLGTPVSPDTSIIYIGDCPHEWLFERVTTVIHHGGAGTTACGLAYERPTVVIPFFGDQPFWGAMVAAAGAGPAPIPHGQLNSENLAEAIRYCQTDQATSAAKSMAAKMKTESGIQDAVDSFHANLPVEAMRCDLIPYQAASWVFRGSVKLKLSKGAAEILVQNSVVRWNQLERYESKPVVVESTRWDPVTATISSLTDTGMGMVTSTANIIVKPVQVYREATVARQQTLLAAPDGSSCITPRPRSLSHGDANTLIHSKSFASSDHPPKNTFGRAVAGSVGGVGGFFHYFSKGMLLDMPLAATEGLRAVPRLYGSEVRDHGAVKDWKSGAIVAGTNFKYSMTEGFSDLVKEPHQGAQKEGALGAAKGLGKGLVNMTTKVSSGEIPRTTPAESEYILTATYLGILGLFAYPGQGLFRSVMAATGGRMENAIRSEIRREGQYMTSDLVAEELVLQNFYSKTR